MTSVKCFGSWLKEAGRGHLTALFGWTTFFIYTVLLVMRLSLDTSYTFFGIGNTVLLWLSMGLGVLFSFLEFFYLLQQKKQDFYYSIIIGSKRWKALMTKFLGFQKIQTNIL